MKKEKNFWDELVKVLYIGLILFICLLFMLILFSIKGHCASEQDYFPIEQNKNGHFTENSISAISNYFDDETNYIVVYYFDYNYRAIVFPKSTYTNNLGQLCGEKNSALTHFSFYGLGIVPTTTYQFQLINGTQVVNLQNFGSGFNYWQNMPSSNYDTSKDYISNLRIWTTNNSTKKLVINYDEEPTYTDPDKDTYPNNADKPEISNYIPSWDNMPQFDNTDVPSALSSIYNIIKWVGENVRDTITGTAEFIGDTIKWAIQKTIDNIRSKIDEVKGVINDIKGFVSDMKDFVEYTAEPLDVSSVQSTITGSTAFGDVSTITGAFADFKGVFDNTSEPSEYKIPFHLESISILNQTQTQYIDLSVISNQRGLIRAFCWVVTTFSLFVTVVDALPNYLKGGDE